MIGQCAPSRFQTILSEPHGGYAERLMRICFGVDISEVHAHQGRSIYKLGLLSPTLLQSYRLCNMQTGGDNNSAN